jgi:hypothetical protein
MVLSDAQLAARKQSALDVIKARKEQRDIERQEREARVGTYFENQAKRSEARKQGIIEKARLRRLNPTAFTSENQAVMGLTGQEARITPEQLDTKQREESRKQLGDLSRSAQPQNFVVMKPLKPSPLDIYGAEKEQQRANIRVSRAFAPVQKM